MLSRANHLLKTNQGAAIVILVALLATAVYLVLSDWPYQRVSDGFHLGTFPLLYLSLSVVFIGVTLFAPGRYESVADSAEYSFIGVIRVTAFITSGIGFAFYQEHLGFVPCTISLALTATIAMGNRSPLILLCYSLTTAIAFFLVFYTLGYAIEMGPGFLSLEIL